MKKLAILVTHPIQYYVPVFQLLAKACDLKVFYTWGEECLGAKYDPGFGKAIDWDIPLLDGYRYEFLKNNATDPGSHHGKGIVNPETIPSLTAFKPDAILVYGYIYHSHFQVMRHFKGKIPIWFRGDSTLLNKMNSFKSALKFIYLRWVYKYVDKAFYVGQNNKAYFRKYGLKESQLAFAPHAIDNARFSKPRTDEVQHLKDRLGIKTENTVILYAGKFEAVKNLSILIEAFKSLPNNTSKLLLIGNGPEEATLKEQAKSNKNILFLPFQNQTYLPVIYQVCDVFCLPSASETWGLAINEAMAAGKAVVVSDKVGSAVDLVDARNGSVFKNGVVRSLTQKLQILTENKNYVAKKGLQSALKITNWSFEIQANAIRKELSKLKNG